MNHNNNKPQMVALKDDIHLSLKVYTAINRKSIRQVVDEILRDFFAKNPVMSEDNAPYTQTIG